VSREAAAALSDTELETRLYPSAEATVLAQRLAVDWPEVHQQLKGKSVTLQLLWEEYRQREPLGYRNSRFCELYRQWRKRIDVTMRQVHRAGEKLFVDYCGQTVPVVDARSGDVHEAQVFVAVWGASNFVGIRSPQPGRARDAGARCTPVETPVEHPTCALFPRPEGESIATGP
jgi:transposase